eukprot:403347376
MDQSIDQILYEQPIDKLAQLRQNLSIMRKKLTQSCNHTQTLKDKTNQLNLGSYLDMLYNQYYNSLNNALSEELKTEKLAVLDDEKNKTLKANQDLSEVVHEISELYENLKSHHIQPSSQNTNGAVGVVANNISNQNQLESNDNSYNSDPYFEMHTKAKFILKNTQREVEDLKSEIQVLKEKIQAKRFNNQ